MIFSPGLNASFNAASFFFTILGYIFVRRKNILAHRACMLAAFLCSIFFLISYLLYHHTHGFSRFTGQGWIRPVYFSVLISHTILAVVILPLVLMTFWLALKGKVERHRRLARVTLPLWMYVSATGVVIYFFTAWSLGTR